MSSADDMSLGRSLFDLLVLKHNKSFVRVANINDPSTCICVAILCHLQCRTVNQGDGGSIPPTTISKLRQFHLPHICLCLSEETLKAGGPFYLVSGEVKDPTQGVNV